MNILLKDPNTNWRCVLLVAALATLVLVGIWMYESFLSVETEMPVVPLSKEEPEIEIPDDWKTYRNEEYEFEVRYPKNFTTEAQKNPYGFIEGACSFVFQLSLTDPSLPKRVYDCCYTEEEIKEIGGIPSIKIGVRIVDCGYKGEESLLGQKTREMLQKMKRVGIAQEMATSTMGLFPMTLQDGHTIWEDGCENYELLEVNNNYFIKGTQCNTGTVVKKTSAVSLPRNDYILQIEVISSEYEQSGVFDQVLSCFKFLD